MQVVEIDRRRDEIVEHGCLQQRCQLGAFQAVRRGTQMRSEKARRAFRHRPQEIELVIADARMRHRAVPVLQLHAAAGETRQITDGRSEEHTSELPSHISNSYTDYLLKNK